MRGVHGGVRGGQKGVVVLHSGGSVVSDAPCKQFGNQLRTCKHARSTQATLTSVTHTHSRYSRILIQQVFKTEIALLKTKLFKCRKQQVILLKEQSVSLSYKNLLVSLSFKFKQMKNQ